MKKVLFVFNHPAPYKVRILNELADFFDLDVIFERDTNSDRPEDFYSEKNYKFNQIKINGLKLGKENFLSFGIIQQIKKTQYDLIVMNGLSNIAEILAILFMKNHKIPYMLYINGGIKKDKECFVKKALKKTLVSSASWFMSPDENSNEYLKAYGASEDKIFAYPYSTIYDKEIVSKCLTNEQKNNARKSDGFKFSKLFVSAGQLIKRKNYEALVREWKKQPKDYALHIYGDGKLYSKISTILQQNGIKNVFLQGFVDKKELFEVYKKADAFIFPSKSDIYGHVVNEALSQGLPVISSNCVNSAKHLIKNGKNGYLFNELGSIEFNEAINAVLNNDFSQECIKTAKENTIEKMVKNHVKIFNEVTKK